MEQDKFENEVEWEKKMRTIGNVGRDLFQCCYRLSKQKEIDEGLSSLLETISNKVECQLW
jgi:hypothetical protein